MITLKVDDRRATAVSRWPITSGSVGLMVWFLFSDEWAGLSKIAVFRGSGTAADIALSINNTTGRYECAIPPEVLEQAGGDLYIGVYGANGEGTVVIPTVWANAGYIKEGTVPSGVDPAAPTPSWVAQVQEWAEEALSIAGELYASVAKTGDTATITLTYYDPATGTTKTTSAQIKDGTDGEDGTNGDDGYSPTVTVTDIEGGHRVAVTDAEGTQSFDVMDGADGAPGQNGTNGTNGTDGEDGSLIWKTDVSPTVVLDAVQWDISDLTGRAGSDPQEGDLVFYSYYYYEISKVVGTTVTAVDPVNIRGPQGEPGGGGGGTDDYEDLENKPQINSVTLSGNKSLADLGIAAASDIPTVPVQSVNGKTGAVVLDASDVGAGTYSKPSGGIPKTDLASGVQNSLDLADTALQSYTETDPTVPSWAKASSKPSYTASEVGAIAAPSSASVGDFLCYTANGWDAVTVPSANGVSF